MNKYILQIFAVLAFIFFIFAIYQYSKDTSFFKSDSDMKNKINDKNNSDKDAVNDRTNKQDNTEDINAEKNDKGAGTGAGSSGSSVDSNPVLPEEKANESACVLARPGNLPNINCFVNYIKRDSISLEIENKLGEDIGISLDLKTCSPKINDEITDNEKKNFIFYCNNNDYFNEDIVITYILEGNGTVAIGGFVNGPVY